MLSYPASTSRVEKLDFIDKIKTMLLNKYSENIEAIGIYGSIAQEKDGPYSDIELHVISRDGVNVPGYELINHPFKIEISTMQKSECDDSWAIKVGEFPTHYSLV